MTTKRNSLAMLAVLCVLAPAVSRMPVWAQAVSQQQVDLSPVFNVSGIFTDGTAISGGLDNGSCGYSSVAMAETVPGPSGNMNPSGTTSYPTLSFPQSSSTITFNFGPENAPDAISGCTPAGGSCAVTSAVGAIPLPTGQFTELELIGSGVQGAQTGTVTVSYTDGSSDNFSQGFSDWFNPGPTYNIGESIALKMPYRLCGSTADNRPFRVYNYEIAINAAKTVQSMTLPNDRNVVILAATLVAIPGFATAAGTPSGTTVSPGNSITIPTIVSSEAGYNGTVNLTCTVSPAIQPSQPAKAPGCTFNPASVGVAVGLPGSSMLTFAPAAPTKSAMARQGSSFLYAFWLPIPGLVLAGFGRRAASGRGKRLLGLLSLGLLLAGVLVIPGCVNYTHLGNVGTPPGKYTIAITGTDSVTGSPQLGAGGTVTVTVQ